MNLNDYDYNDDYDDYNDSYNNYNDGGNADDFKIIALQDALTEKAAHILSDYNRILDDNAIDEDDDPMNPMVLIRNRVMYIYKHINRLDNADMTILTQMHGKLEFAAELLDDINEESPLGKLY